MNSYSLAVFLMETTMTGIDFRRWHSFALTLAFVPLVALAQGDGAKEEFTPEVGQAGKDVIWVPTPEFLVERMLQMAQVGPNDLVVDLGSGDGRTVIAAAKKFHANSVGIEFNPDMVALSKRNAEKAGVAADAKFIEADIFASDFHKATVVTMYLLPDLNLRLRPRLLEMKPGTRLVSHQFTMGEWQPDEISSFDNRSAYFWVVPARVEGSWKLGYAGRKSRIELTLDLKQTFQMVEGAIVAGQARLGLRDVRLRGDRFDFSFVDDNGVLREFSGRVLGKTMSGSMKAGGKPGGQFRAARNS
jgi:SAM-dependent methyltransferase